MSLIIAAIGVVGVASPSTLLGFARSLETPGALLVVAAVRVVFGALLWLVSPVSRMPRTLRVIGIVIIVAGLATPFFGVERSQALLNRWTSQGPIFTRAWAVIAVIFGLFIAYVVSSRRRAAA
jgi:hypothetical protein